MRILKKKISKSFKGRGDDKTNVDVNYSLLPPSRGIFLQSIDYVNSLDLICEGEIEGFVNDAGDEVQGLNVLGSIILDDTPILENTNSGSGIFNFKNISVNYRLGSELQSPMDGFGSPVKQKTVNFALLGKFAFGKDTNAQRATAIPLFEEDASESETIINPLQTKYPFNNETEEYVELNKYLRLTGLNITNPGAGYTVSSPAEVTFSDLGDPRISGGEGIIYTIPDITFNIDSEGSISNHSINDGGLFEGSYVIEIYSGEKDIFNYSGSGVFDNFPPSNIQNNVNYTGTGEILYFLNKDGSEIYPNGTGLTGTYSGFFVQADQDQFACNFITGDSDPITIVLLEPFDSNGQFDFTGSGEYFQRDSSGPFFEESGVEPTYLANFSDPENFFGEVGDVRNGINYSSWNTDPPEPTDRQAYTHIVQNSNVDSVSAIINIKRLNDTEEEVRSVSKITNVDFNLFEGEISVEADAAFIVGQPTDSFVKIKVEIGFLNTDFVESNIYTYNGQTVNGYLVETPKLGFSSYKQLKESSQEYSDLSIKELKRAYPKFIRVSKNMFETDSALINRSVSLESIKEYFDTELTYPNSAIIGTKINSTYFSQIPKREYDLKLKKIWVPETYNIKSVKEDKRFRESGEINENPTIGIGTERLIFNEFSQKSSENNRFGASVSINNNALFITDPEWGSFSQTAFTYSNFGNIFIFDDWAQGSSLGVSGVNDFKMIRDGIPRNSNLTTIARGESNLPDFDIVNGDTGGGQDSTLTSTSRTVEILVTVALTVVINDYILGGRPMSATHSTFLRISPRKSATLRFNVSSDTPSTNNDYRELSRAVSGVVVGLVKDPTATSPDQVIATYVGGTSHDNQEIEVRNTSETEYQYVKFFGAQLKGYVVTTIEHAYGQIQTAQIVGGDFAPKYDGDSLLPSTITISSLTMTDEDMKDYLFNSETDVFEVKGDYLLFGTRLNEESVFNPDDGPAHALGVLKKSSNGFWYNLQSIRFQIDGEQNFRKPLCVSFFDSYRFVVVWESENDDNKNCIEIYSLNSEGVFELESSFDDFLGVFEGLEVYDLDADSYGYCSTVGENTIIISRDCSIRETDSTDGLLSDGVSFYNTFVYKVNDNNYWSLNQIIINPEYKVVMGSFSPPRIDTAGPWLVIGSKHYDAQSFENDIGIILLYRYNGKKYEYIRRFYSDRINDVDQNGEPIDDNYETTFGEVLKIELDANEEPVIVTTSKNDQSSLDENKDIAIYIFRRHPNKNDWLRKRYEIDDGFLRPNQEVGELGFAQNTTHGKSLDFDGQNIVFSLENQFNQNFASYPDNAGVITVPTTEKSTRLYEGNDWFGMMKKEWSDNPVWIIYDLLTNPIYGAGAVLDDLKDINIFNFYEISKYFDSCSEDGFYIPIYDEKGQTEPRVSCNFLLDEDYNAFEVISSICDLFFGAVYIKDGKYNIWADRPTKTSWYFNNNDVLDGSFSYSDSAKSQRPSLVKVSFLDKYEKFKPKLEFVEDSVLMRENGKIEAELDFAAFSTRSQARRFGKQYLYNKSYETERVTFQTDDKALFLKPGDVIGINDELRTFENERAFWRVNDVKDYKEKIYAVQHAKSEEVRNKFLFSEIIISAGNTDDFETNYIEQEISISSNFDGFDVKVDNSGVPYILGITDGGDSAVYKKDGNSFQEVIFEAGSFYPETDSFLSNLEFDSSNKPYFSIIEDEPSVGFIKFTGTDFQNTGHWQKVLIENLDPLSEGWQPVNNYTSVIKIADNDEKYILTHRSKSSPASGEYLLYHYDGNGEDSNPSSWDRYVIDSQDKRDRDYHFDMELILNKPAIAYTSHATGAVFDGLQIRYTELLGGTIDLDSSWDDVFVAERASEIRKDNFYLSFGRNLTPYISHVFGTESSFHIHSPLSHSDRFDREKWGFNSTFLDYDNTNGGTYSRLSIEQLQDDRILVFNRGYRSSSKALRSLQFYELSNSGDWFKPQNWKERTVFKTTTGDDIDVYFNNQPTFPSTTYDFNGGIITLDNSSRFLFDNDFSLDTNIENNLEIVTFSDSETDDLYNELKFKGASIKAREDFKIDISGFITVTGYETSGNFINLFLSKTAKNAKEIRDLNISNAIARPVKNVEKYKEYRVLDIREKDVNLYEVEAKEYHSEKFDVIDQFASIEEPKESEYSIGLPTNIINRPPEPLGISYKTGIDDGGSSFLTGQITGEVNGDEEEYRLFLTYPNGKFIEKEIEKDANNLSPLNNPLTNFGFYNLAAVGDYELTVKSLKNPESSEFIKESFVINETKDKISTYPFLEDLNISTSLEAVKVKIKPKNVYGDHLNLSDSLCRIKVKIDEETWIEDSKLTEFETSFQEIKDLTNNSNREKQFKAELTINGQVVSEIYKTLDDEPPRISNAEFISDGSVARISLNVSDNEKLRYIDLKTGENIIKTFAPENQNKIQSFSLHDFEIDSLPKKERINFCLTPRDFYGTGESYEVEGFIPEKESVFEKYKNSILPIYSIYSVDEVSNGFSGYNSSNSQTGFYGNGENCLIEFSSSLISGEQASLNLEIRSQEENKSISLDFSDDGFLSTKKILKLSKKYYNIDISGQNGLFDGFELKVKKLV